MCINSYFYLFSCRGMNIFSGTSGLADSLSQFLEVKNQLFEIALVVNIETVPEISTDCLLYTSESGRHGDPW